MRQREQRLWDAMKRNAPKGIWLQRIENAVGVGIPDVLAVGRGRGVDVWIELKAPISPRRSSTRLMGDEGARPSQIGWHLKAAVYGVESYFLIKSSGGGLYLIDGAEARNVNELTETELTEQSKIKNWSELWRIIG